MKNEAELEVRIGSLLTSVFPTFKEVKVVHQQSFSIRFGHHLVEVDLKNPTKYPARAIFDILLTIEGENIILLELKREGLSLIQEDIDQGISYARLLHPMPPLTLISNGTDNRFYNTYTKEIISNQSIDIEYIHKLTNNSFQLATNDFKDAVNLLINNEPELFSQVINQISEEKFIRLSGELTNFTKQICIDFNIPRKVILEIQSLFSNANPLIGVIGSAFSGKTNLLYQFFVKTKAEKNFLLYLDCCDHNYSILQQLANHFTETTRVLITIDKIREWLINSLNNSLDSKFYLLLDNFNDEIPEKIKSEIIELIDIFKGINHHTLYTIDEFNYKKIAFVENRQYRTIIGEQSLIVKLDELNDDEYQLTNEILFDKFKIVIDNGGHYTPEYREPRILRHLAGLYKGVIKEGQLRKIIAVPDLDLLNAISKNKTYTKKVNDLYYKISCCFLGEADLRKNDSDLNIVASGSGAISIGIFKKTFSDDLENLIKSSVVVLRELRNGTTVIYPKIQELIAKHSIGIVTRIILKQKKDGKSIDLICKALIDAVTPIPYCDIVATGVLLELAYKYDADLFSALIQELLKTPPHIEKITKGTKTLMYLEDMGHIQIDFQDDVDEGGFVSDFLPYAILSQIAGYPLSLIDNENYSEYAFHLHLIYEVGSNENFLRRADVRSLSNMKYYENYDWENIGSIVCGREGIIEPIVQSILKCFLKIPDEIKKLYERAFDENNFPLVWRIYLALRTMTNSTDDELANQANDFITLFNEYFKKFMDEFMTKDILDEEEKREMREVLATIRIDDLE